MRPRECNPSSAGPRAQGAGDTAQDPALPPGQAESRRTQDSEDAPATGRPRAVQVSAPCPPEHPGPCGLVAAGITAGADTRAGELATASVLVPPDVTLCLGRSRATTEQEPHGVNRFH